MARGRRARDEVTLPPLPAPALVDDGGEDPRFRLSWFDPPFVPDVDLCDQAYGFCVTETDTVVLVHAEGDGWTLPGGGVEAGETLEDTLRREVAEEACAEVLAFEYLGCQLVDPLHDLTRAPFFQTRFWARVALGPFEARDEITDRRCVEPNEFLSTLWWGHTPIAAHLFTAGMTVERARSAQ